LDIKSDVNTREWYSDERIADQRPLSNRLVVVAYRHQEYSDTLSDEMNEMMSLFGRHATVDESNGNSETWGAAWLARMIRHVRRSLGIDWLPRVLRQASLVRDHYHRIQQNDGSTSEIIYTGFSVGGYWAQLAALNTATSLNSWFVPPTVVFAANGIEDMVTEFYPNDFPVITHYLSSNISPLTPSIENINELDEAAERPPAFIPSIINLSHMVDAIPRMDCQIGLMCTWSYTDIELKSKRKPGHSSGELGAYVNSIHESHIYGRDPGIGALHGIPLTTPQPVPEMLRLWTSRSIATGLIPTCTTGSQYSALYGSCRREAARWQQRLNATRRIQQHHQNNESSTEL
jgi:hypothetical protein